jgi:RNA polymerase sigma-70 factor (ECF subfamily)
VTHARDFEALVLPHLNAAYNLARWLVRDSDVAEDLVQDACLRAFRYFAALHGEDARPWLLGIVRNNCYSWLDEQKRLPGHVALDDELNERIAAPDEGQGRDPGVRLDEARSRRLVDAAIGALPPRYREVIVLRELEELSYAEIARIADIPIGTVMSRLSRAREELKQALSNVMGRN